MKTSKRNKFIVTTIFLLLSFVHIPVSSNAQYSELLHKTYGQRTPPLVNLYQNVIRYADSTTVFSTISKIEKLALSQKDEDLLLETQLMRAHYYYYRNNYSEEKVLTILKELSETGQKKGKVWLQAMAENLTALYYFYTLKKYELGFEHHLKVYQLIKDLPASEFPNKQQVLRQIAEQHYIFEDYQESIFYAQKALRANVSSHMTIEPFPSHLTILNTIGSSFQKEQQLDSAAHYYNLVLQEAKKSNSTIWMGIAKGNLGRVQLMKGNAQASISLLEEELAAAKEYGDWDLCASSSISLAEALLTKQQTLKAKTHLDQALVYIRRHGEDKRLKDLYPLYSKFHALNGNSAKAVQYLDLALIKKDSVNKEVNRLKMLRASQRIELENYRNSLTTLETQRKYNILERNLLLFVLFTTISLATAYLWRLKKNQQEKQERAKEELELATLQLKNFSKDISEKDSIIKILEGRKLADAADIIEKLRQSTILTDEDWDLFKSIFEKAHNGFFYRLKIQFPDLSPAEVRFMALSRLNLSARDMASMLGVGTDTIRQHRSRIKRKLKLNEETSPEHLALTI